MSEEDQIAYAMQLSMKEQAGSDATYSDFLPMGAAQAMHTSSSQDSEVGHLGWYMMSSNCS